MNLQEQYGKETGKAITVNGWSYTGAYVQWLEKKVLFLNGVLESKGIYDCLD